MKHEYGLPRRHGRELHVVALPQIPPRNVTWARPGKWVHLDEVAFEKCFLRNMRTGNSERVYEKYVMKAPGIGRFKQSNPIVAKETSS